MILKNLKNRGSKALHSFENRTAKAQRVSKCMSNTRNSKRKRCKSSTYECCRNSICSCAGKECRESIGKCTSSECLRSFKKLTVNESRYKASKSCLRSLKSFTGKNTRYESFRSLESFTSKECCRNLRSFKCFTSNDAWYKASKSCFRCLSKFAGDESERSLQTVVNDNNRCALNDRSSFNDGSNDSRYIRVIPADRKLLMGATVLCRCDILIARIFHVA